MKSVEAVKMFMMGLLVAVLAVIAFRATPDVNAYEGGASSGTFIALTSNSNNGRTSVLYLIDSENKFISLYGYDDSQFQFRASRYYGFDMGIVDMNMRRGLGVDEAKEWMENSIEEMERLKAGDKKWRKNKN